MVYFYIRCNNDDPKCFVSSKICRIFLSVDLLTFNCSVVIVTPIHVDFMFCKILTHYVDLPQMNSTDACLYLIICIFNVKNKMYAFLLQGIKIENFSTSWNDGMAFCALIHHFYPDAFDFDKLNPKNRRYNFDLAFRTAE